MSIDSVLLQPALPPHFTWAMANQLGVGRRQLAGWVEIGAVRRPFRDVYVRSSVPDTIDTRLSAVSLVLPRHAVVVDRTAAWVWGVDTLRHWELDFLPRLEVFVLRGHKRVTRTEVGGGSRDLAERDLSEVNGVRVTTPLRTALDLCCRLPRYGALAAADSLAREHGLDREQMQRELVRFRGRRGVIQARALVQLVDPRAESPGESFTRLAIVEAGLPVPVAQHWVEMDGTARFRLDLAYPSLKICVEYDGVEFHSTAQQRAADAARREWLRSHGWHVVVVRKNGFHGPELDRWLSELRQVYAERTSRAAY